MNIVEMCVNKIKEKNRVGAVNKDIIADYLKKCFGLKITSKMKKLELIDMVYERLDQDSLSMLVEYIPAIGLSRSDISEIYGCSKAQLDKPIKKGIIRKVNSIQRIDAKYIVTYLYDIRDVITLYETGGYPKAKPKKEYNLDLSDENIAKALYIINKSAKKSRDTKMKGYCNGAHGVCHSAKTRSKNLYHLKDCTINKLYLEGRINYNGIVRQEVDDNIVCLDEYGLKNYTFHVPHEDRVNKAKVLDKVIKGEISAGATRQVSLKFNEAKWILEQYTGEKATGTYNTTNVFY